jgi:hypothetical protein
MTLQIKSLKFPELRGILTLARWRAAIAVGESGDKSRRNAVDRTFKKILRWSWLRLALAPGVPERGSKVERVVA